MVKNSLFFKGYFEIRLKNLDIGTLFIYFLSQCSAKKFAHYRLRILQGWAKICLCREFRLIWACLIMKS